MKFRLMPALAASVLAVSSLGAMAQPSPAANCPMQGASGTACPRQDGPMGMRGHMDPSRMEAMRTQRHADLKAKLKLSPEQEGAWTSFTEAMKPPAQADAKRPDRAELAKLTTPERIDRMRALRSERMSTLNAAMDKRDEAVKTFYGALNADQKKVFDAEHARMGMEHGARQGMRQRMGNPDGAGKKP